MMQIPERNPRSKDSLYSDRDSLFKWGVWMNGPAIGGWNIRGAWGSGLRTDSLAMMHDDGTNGDATAGDSIYTVQFKYQKNSTMLEWNSNLVLMEKIMNPVLD